MTLYDKYQLAMWGDLFIPVAVALLILFICLYFRQVVLGILLGVFIAWVVAYFFRVNVTSELGMDYYDSMNPNSDYDGCRDNVVVLFFGWVLPLIAVLGATSIRALWGYFGSRTPSSAERFGNAGQS